MNPSASSGQALLQTKLQIPIIRSPSLVRRSRLFEKLNGGLSGTVTLVAAPAGFGKTTLLAEWVRDGARFPGAAAAPATAWLSLDEQDNDPARFLAYLTAALERVHGQALHAAPLQGEGPLPGMSLEAAITPLINALGRAPQPFLLVLDDYHLIQEPHIHQALTFLLGHLPPPMHLVLSSRADPPLPVARLRGQGALNEVRQEDLCFTEGETGELLERLLGLELPAEDLARLKRRTEGWPAGLQMAAVSLGQREDPAAFIQAFSGSNRYILDYLMEEVLAQQTPATQQFLLLTSVLGRLTDSLCADLQTAVPHAGGAGDWPSLEDLDAAHLFVVPLDDQRHWYRYHRLFADLLNQRLQKTTPQLVPLLHARARDWFWQEGWPEEAVGHALQAGEDEEAARLVEEVVGPALQKSRLHTILRWVRALPEELVRERARLRLYYAWALFLSGAPFEEVETWLPQLAEEALREAPLPAALLIHAFVAAMRGEMREARSLAQQVMHGLGPDDPFWRSMAVWVLSISYHDPLAEPPSEGLTWEDAVRVARESDNVLVMVSAMCEQGHDYKRHGRLHEAREVFEQALSLATPPGDRPAPASPGQRLPVAGEALMGLAEIDLEWNRLDSAEALLEEGLALTRQWREIATLPGCFQLARLRRAQGDQDGAEEALREAARLARLFDATELDDTVVAAYQARLWIMQGRPSLAQAWAVEQGLANFESPSKVDGEYTALHSFVELILSRLWLAQGEVEAALQLQDRLLIVFRAWQHVRLLIETLLLRAQGYAARGETDRAHSDVQEALVLGEPGGFVRVFVDEGEPVRRLLESFLMPERGSRAYVEQLLKAFGTGGDAAAAAKAQPLVEPLTERELEILQLVAEGLSNREIGQRLFLSLPTVKWHTSNIYGKLGVRNRTTAAAKARELGILQS